MFADKQYLQKRKVELRVFDARLQLARAKASTAEADIKKEYLETVQHLEDRFISAQKSLINLVRGVEADWEDLMRGVEEAFGSLTDAFNRAADVFLDSALKIKREERRE